MPRAEPVPQQGSVVESPGHPVLLRKRGGELRRCSVQGPRQVDRAVADVRVREVDDPGQAGFHRQHVFWPEVAVDHGVGGQRFEGVQQGPGRVTVFGGDQRQYVGLEPLHNFGELATRRLWALHTMPDCLGRIYGVQRSQKGPQLPAVLGGGLGKWFTDHQFVPDHQRFRRHDMRLGHVERQLRREPWHQLGFHAQTIGDFRSPGSALDPTSFDQRRRAVPTTVDVHRFRHTTSHRFSRARASTD